MEYRVSWVIQLDEENPLDAAKKALAWIKEEDSICHVFDVAEEGKPSNAWTVDLDEDDEHAVLELEQVSNYGTKRDH